MYTREIAIVIMSTANNNYPVKLLLTKVSGSYQGLQKECQSRQLIRPITIVFGLSSCISLEGWWTRVPSHFYL